MLGTFFRAPLIAHGLEKPQMNFQGETFFFLMNGVQDKFRSRQANIETKWIKVLLNTCIHRCKGLFWILLSFSFLFGAGLDFESVLWFVRNKHWFYWILRHQRSQEETDKQERPLHQPKSCKDHVFIICNVSWQCCYWNKP